VLEVENLNVQYGAFKALYDVSLTVENGLIVSIVGANGAGKTTLLNTISGLTLDYQTKERRAGGQRVTIMGEMTFEGQDFMPVPAYERVRRGVVICRERHPIFPDSNVVENLKIAAFQQPDGRKQFDAGLKEAFELFPALRLLKTRKAGFLSGGEQQMLAIAMALLARPRLLLLDEPLLGLSPHMQQAVMEAILTINRDRGITVLIAEQFVRPVLPVINHGYVIENGMLTLVGTGQELMDNPEIKSAYFGV
jgi:branched-chain amino acid transport system ATP-binding protein